MELLREAVVVPIYRGLLSGGRFYDGGCSLLGYGLFDGGFLHRTAGRVRGCDDGGLTGPGWNAGAGGVRWHTGTI